MKHVVKPCIFLAGLFRVASDPNSSFHSAPKNEQAEVLAAVEQRVTTGSHTHSIRDDNNVKEPNLGVKIARPSVGVLCGKGGFGAVTRK